MVDFIINLSSSEQQQYKTHHPQVAPDVRNGVNKQSEASDIYFVWQIGQYGTFTWDRKRTI